MILDQKGFDKWAGDYDASISELSKGYPFEGYYNVLGTVHNTIYKTEGKQRGEAALKGVQILDIGVGTGLLTQQLYKDGASITALDFSEKMLTLAKEKMPNAAFHQHNLQNGIPSVLLGQQFDYIISSYVLHHFEDAPKVSLLKAFKSLLKTNGQLIIADISFSKQADFDQCYEKYKRGWDEDEFYMVVESITPHLQDAGFTHHYQQVSSCAGVLVLS